MAEEGRRETGVETDEAAGAEDVDECADHGLGSIAGACLQADLWWDGSAFWFFGFFSHFSGVEVLGLEKMGAYLD